jgi:sodium transport system permease protein
MTFSIATALLNLISMQATATFVMQQFARLGSQEAMLVLGPLPINAMGWLVMMLLPMSALFSALALAVAALARSSKEGQYYLMPLLLVGMPLVMLPMLPGMELSIGTSIVPVTGAVLLSRSLIEGQYHQAVLHLPFVLFVTAMCCLLAVRWAVRQFESESVMFRESDRFDLSTWLRHVWRDRGETASPSEAILCGLIILVALFFGRLMASEQALSWESVANSAWVIQLGLIATPCLIMATILTRSVRCALRLTVPRWSDLLVSAGLAVCLHPTYVLFAGWIQQEYALGADTKMVLQQMDQMIASVPLVSVLFFLAVMPAICEELAFRGFIFGGLEQNRGALRAILLSSLFFGLSHGVLQQTITASAMGLVLGVLAWRTGGVLCGMAFHMMHNGLTMWLARAARTEESMPDTMHWFFVHGADGWQYSPTWTTLSVALGILGIAWLFRPSDAGLSFRATRARALLIADAD